MKEIVKEVLGAVAVTALFVVLFVAYLVSTPPQLSGEGDWSAQEEADMRFQETACAVLGK